MRTLVLLSYHLIRGDGRTEGRTRTHISYAECRMRERRGRTADGRATQRPAREWESAVAAGEAAGR